MPLQIWKFELKLEPIAKVEMPEGAECLFVHEQAGKLRLWAKVDTLASKTTRYFEIFNTGDNMPVSAKRTYIGSDCINYEVKHVFEIIG